MWIVKAALVATTVLAPIAARADFKVCNRSAEAVSVALGFIEGDTWYAAGWLNLNPGACGNALSGRLNNQYYYVRAEGTEGGLWGGDYPFCTTPSSFKLASTEDCETGSIHREGFFQVDTGESLDWTLDLED